ncbi:MAG: proline dehydrogenase family protein [Pseudonocardia sp.]
MLRTALLAASRSPRVRALVERGPTRAIVTRFVAGTTVDDVLAVVHELVTDRLVTVDHLGENVTDRAGARATVGEYRVLLARLRDAGLADRVEVSVKLSALGQSLDRDAQAITLEHARAVCVAAASAGTTVTVDMEDHTTTDATLATVRALRADFPWVGAVVQAQLRRAEADCRELAHPGSRVRLCKGAYDEPGSVAYRDPDDVRAAFARCLDVLAVGGGLPMVATHDPAMIALARTREPRELQMLYGVRPRAQQELAAEGERVRVYLPYGTDWYAYFMRRLAERPANVTFFLRSLLTRG